MKKIALFAMLAVGICYGESALSADYHWSGLYVGGNLGYWASQTNNIMSTGSVGYINPAYLQGATNVANALAQLATKSAAMNSYGLVGGGQIGYNRELSHSILLGINLDFDGLTNSDNNITMQKTVNLVDYNENYVGSLSIIQKMNYLGTMRARLGYLYQPTILIYAVGGFALGNMTLNTNWTARESLGPNVFPTITSQNNINHTLTGWTAGAGVEWLFKPHWSALLEYSYYSFSDLNVPATLSQTNATTSPPVVWARAATNTTLSLSLWNVRLGLNYHFL